MAVSTAITAKAASETHTDTETPTPAGFLVRRENSTGILVPADTEAAAFFNPVQEFNRDLSVACISVWAERVGRERAAKMRASRNRNESASARKGKGKKARVEEGVKAMGDGAAPVQEGVSASAPVDVTMVDAGPAKEPVTNETALAPGEENDKGEAVTGAPQKRTPGHKPYRVVLLEALSATGLRAIRYAKEIPLVKYVIANDLSPEAVEAIRRNVAYNGVGGESEGGDSTSAPKASAKVVVNEGDACDLMYAHRPERKRVDCVDLDPYGTAAPFIDAAVQCVNDGGLVCVTCTDMQVLATNNYPEKCYSNYGGVPVKAEYCHEAALRLVLHSLSTSAGRYGRYIEPLLSLSIDFYVRLFVRVHSGASEVKKAASKTSMFYVCSGCQAFYEQPLGKIVEKVSDKTGQTNYLHRQKTGPPVGEKCPECESPLHVCGPMWNAPLHDKDFVQEVLTHCQENKSSYGTAARMEGMLTLAKDELATPFYFTPSRMAGLFHCISPALELVAAALLHAGFVVSRSHAQAGSIKTDATPRDVRDVFRGWVKEHPVKEESVSKTSPAYYLHAREPRFEANFSHHAQASELASPRFKLVRYQQNPTPNWGPGSRPKGKRKREEDE